MTPWISTICYASCPLLSHDEASYFLYLFPHIDRAVLETRQYLDSAPERSLGLTMNVRNRAWSRWVPAIGRASREVPISPLRRRTVNIKEQALVAFLTVFARGTTILPVEQIVDFEDGAHEFTFSMWAFAEDQFAEILPRYRDFCLDFERKTGFRTHMPDGAYHMEQDASSLLSYSPDGPVWTLDPVTPLGREPLWKDFLLAFNDFADHIGGRPLLNQTPYLTRAMVEKAFGASRLERLRTLRGQVDPDNRLLNRYFAELLA